MLQSEYVRPKLRFLLKADGRATAPINRSTSDLGLGVQSNRTRLRNLLRARSPPRMPARPSTKNLHETHRLAKSPKRTECTLI